MASRKSFFGNFNMNLEASGTIEMASKIQCSCTLVHGEALRQFDLLSSDMEIENPLKLEAIILGLDAYFFLLISYQIKST